MSPKKNEYTENRPEGFEPVDPETGEVRDEAEGFELPGAGGPAEELAAPDDAEKPASAAEGNGRDEIRFKIFKHFGVIGKGYQNRDIELNWVSWNDGYAKYDIRAWDRIHEHMSKGITLKTEEAIRLRDILNTVDFNKYGFRKPDAPAPPPAENAVDKYAETR